MQTTHYATWLELVYEEKKREEGRRGPTPKEWRFRMVSRKRRWETDVEKLGRKKAEVARCPLYGWPMLLVVGDEDEEGRRRMLFVGVTMNVETRLRSLKHLSRVGYTWVKVSGFGNVYARAEKLKGKVWMEGRRKAKEMARARRLELDRKAEAVTRPPTLVGKIMNCKDVGTLRTWAETFKGMDSELYAECMLRIGVLEDGGDERVRERVEVEVGAKVCEERERKRDEAFKLLVEGLRSEGVEVEVEDDTTTSDVE